MDEKQEAVAGPQVVTVHGGQEEHLEAVDIPAPRRVAIPLNRKARRTMMSKARQTRQVPGAFGRQP